MTASLSDRVADFVALSDPGACALKRFGGKGARLAMLRQAGFAVPDGVVVAADAFAGMFRDAGLTPAAGELPRSDLSIEHRSAALTEAVLAAELPDDVLSQAEAWLAQAGALAVRSSAVHEDGIDRAAAGQYESVLGVADAPTLARACKQVLASQFALRVLRYWGRAPSADNEIALLLQRMLAPSISGVIFTCDPVSGERDVLVFEAAPGLGTSIVQGGGATERTVVLRRTQTLVSQDLRSASRATFFDADSRTLSTNEGAQELTLTVSPEQRVVLVETACAVEDLFGIPMDIEWSIEHNRVFVLQARPITALGRVR